MGFGCLFWGADITQQRRAASVPDREPGEERGMGSDDVSKDLHRGKPPEASPALTGACGPPQEEWEGHRLGREGRRAAPGGVTPPFATLGVATCGHLVLHAATATPTAAPAPSGAPTHSQLLLSGLLSGQQLAPRLRPLTRDWVPQVAR